MTMANFPRRQSGFSLLELMIAITIGLFLLAGLSAVFVTSNRNYADLSKASQQIENGRFAVQTVADELSLAGYYGRYTGVGVTAPGTLPDPCLVPASGADLTLMQSALALQIQGYDAPTTTLPSCIASANHVSGTDILVIRRADSQVAAGNSASIADGALVQNQIYIQANGTNSAPIINKATGTGATDTGNFTLLNRDSTTRAPIRKYHVHIYFVAPCSIPAGGGTTCTGSADDNGKPIPTLKRLELSLVTSGTNTSCAPPASCVLGFAMVSLVEGVENFQVDYGIDTDGDGAPDGAYTMAPANVTAWTNVVAARLNVLARNLEADTGYTDDKTYDLGLAGTVTPLGSYKRHVYNAVVRVVNPSARRES